MRRDFAKLVFERPKSNRTWASKTPRPAAVQIDPEGLLVNDQTYRRRRQKLDGGRATAVRRFLESQLGRPWRRVFSELSALADARSYTGVTIRHYVASLVEVDCWVDGHVVRSAQTGERVRGLFVHPVSGLLRRAPANR